LLTCGGEISPVVDDCKVYTEEGAVDIALEFMLHSPTFRTGIHESVNVTSVSWAGTLTPYWVVRVDFVYLYPAYGNLVGLLKDPTYAPHLISIVVEEGVVVSAVVDGVWDEMAQKTIN
jgi:hypothetical protein